MTTLNDAREAVYGRFLANFTEVSSDAIAFDNEELEQPSDEWVRLTIRTVNRQQDTLGAEGNRSFKSDASAFVQCFVRSNTGTQRADVIARDAAEALEGASFSGVSTLAAIPREQGVTGMWFMMLVEVPFSFYETK